MSEKVVYFQGIGASKHQIERVLSAGLFARDEVYVPETDLEEVVPREEFGWNVFFHLCALAIHFKNALLGLARVPLFALRFWKATIGGYADVQALKLRHEACPEAEILFGISRGALVTFLYVAGDAPQLESVKLVVLEGCPSSIPDVLKLRHPYSAPFMEWLLSVFTKYDPAVAKYFSAAKFASTFPHKIPVAFITSRADKSVPIASTLAIYQALADAGHPHLNLLVLEDAHHDKYATTPNDGEKYSSFIKELRAKYRV